MQSSEKKPSGPEALESPTSGEVEVLAVLWEAVARGAQALRLSEVRQLLSERRGRATELSTVSTQLRSLHAKGWLEELGVSLAGPPVVRTRGAVRVRGGAQPARSPFTAYRPKYQPGDALRRSLQELALAYPESERRRLLIDVAQALELPAQTIAAIEKLVQEGGQ